jgi:hypothetical protein
MLQLLPFAFQPNQARDLRATYHFEFTGDEQRKATIVIHDGVIRVREGHIGSADLRVTADSLTWLGFLAREHSLVWALLRRTIRVGGSPKLLLAFGRCFRAPPFAMIRRPCARFIKAASNLPLPPERRGDGKIKWSGALRLAEIIEVARTSKPSVSSNRREERSFRIPAGQFLTFAIEPFGIPTSAPTPSRPRPRAGLDRDHGETGNTASFHDGSMMQPCRRPLEVRGSERNLHFRGRGGTKHRLIGGGVGDAADERDAYLTDTSWPGDIHLLLSFRSPRDYPFKRNRGAANAQQPPAGRSHDERS